MSEVERKCYTCGNYRESLFCGYISSHCEIYGSLDVDQHERHPDTAADTCEDFAPKKPKRPPTEKERIQRMIRALWPDGYHS